MAMAARTFGRLHLAAGKAAHQVILQREEEDRGARVALAGTAAAKLVVNTARFVALSAHHVQAAFFVFSLVTLITLPMHVSGVRILRTRTG